VGGARTEGVLFSGLFFLQKTISSTQPTRSNLSKIIQICSNSSTLDQFAPGLQIVGLLLSHLQDLGLNSSRVANCGTKSVYTSHLNLRYKNSLSCPQNHRVDPSKLLLYKNYFIHIKIRKSTFLRRLCKHVWIWDDTECKHMCANTCGVQTYVCKHENKIEWRVSTI
jgi:hypothetical protein